MLTVIFKLRQKGIGARSHKRLKSLAAGMTLVEILVAMVVLALGIAGLLALQTQTLNAGALAAGRNVATFLAESQSEWLRTMDINKVGSVSQAPELLTTSGQLCADAPSLPCYFTRTTTITKGVPTTNSYAVSIKVEWLNKEVVYDTVVSGIGFF